MPQVKSKVKKPVGLSIPVYSLLGKETGVISLPKEIFGAKVNKILLAQAMRVYLNNQKTLPGSTKTRGQVEGSSAKIYNQKGTGRARHGSIRAPIFVGGGIVFGPTPRKVILNLPNKMKKAALISALSEKVLDKKALGLSGSEKATGKTKEMVNTLKKINEQQALTKGHEKKQMSTLIVTGEKLDNIVRAVKNISNVSILPANLLNAYEVLKHDFLLLTADAVEKLEGAKK